MKLDKNLTWSLILLVIVAAIYRVIPGRPPGFAPQIAIAIFAGAVIKDKRLALAIPVLSMFFSDMFYQILYTSGVSSMPGFYEGQWENYVLFGLLTLIGFAVRKINVLNILIASLLAPTAYFILSNFVLWASPTGTRGFDRPRNWGGLMQTYIDGLPFYRTSLIATIAFSVILFGSYYLLKRVSVKRTAAASDIGIF